MNRNLIDTKFFPTAKPWLWVVFIVYIIVASYTMFHHEMWADELHSWNIAKASNSLFDLIQNRRYEGHPPLWYIILWSISKFTHNLVYVQAVHLLIAILVVFVILFYSPLPTTTKILLPFGYYFLFEYAILSRNYTLGVLAAFLICIIIQKNCKYKLVWYYCLLLIMSNVHLLALILAGSLHLYFLLLNIEQKKKRHIICLHFFLGLLVFLPAIYFIFPPSDSTLNISLSFNASRFAEDMQTTLRAFIPMPAWWEYNFWNIQFLLDLHKRYSILKVISPLLSFGLIGLGCYILRDNKKSLLLFTANIIVTFIVGIFFALATQRYSGYIFIGFVVAYWLYCYDKPVPENRNTIINTMLVVQLIAGIFIVVKDIRLPFSNSYRIKELISKAPLNEKIVTDYWSVNTISAYTEKPVYSLMAEKELSFLSLGSDINVKQFAALKNIYCYYLYIYFEKKQSKTLYMVANQSPKELSAMDPKLFTSFHVQLTDKIDGAIEKGSNFYLYKISML
jgi:hypothetical protein